MATTSFPIAYYHVYIAREFTPTLKMSARILCRGTDGRYLTICFLRPGSTMPDNYCSPDAKRGTVYVPAEQFSWYMDLLRNEKPVYAYLNSDRPILNRLYTGPEPVGEGEEV